MVLTQCIQAVGKQALTSSTGQKIRKLQQCSDRLQPGPSKVHVRAVYCARCVLWYLTPAPAHADQSSPTQKAVVQDHNYMSLGITWAHAHNRRLPDSCMCSAAATAPQRDQKHAQCTSMLSGLTELASTERCQRPSLALLLPTCIIQGCTSQPDVVHQALATIKSSGSPEKQVVPGWPQSAVRVYVCTTTQKRPAATHRLMDMLLHCSIAAEV